MATETPPQQKVMVKEMSWDPITRIVGSLGIHTEIDFTNQQVLKCWSTSMLFRGFDIFMKGIDPRDAHFITSRICGICMACTMPGFPDKYMPFMQEDKNARLSSTAASFTYGPVLRYFRARSIDKKFDKEPPWRNPGSRLASGYTPRW
jgi:hypothetical protein